MPKDYSSSRSLFQRGFVYSPQALDLQPLTCKFQSVGSLPKTSKTHCQTTKPTRLLLNQFSDSNFITYLLWAFSISLRVSLESTKMGHWATEKRKKNPYVMGDLLHKKSRKFFWSCCSAVTSPAQDLCDIQNTQWYSGGPVKQQQGWGMNFQFYLWLSL